MDIRTRRPQSTFFVAILCVLLAPAAIGNTDASIACIGSDRSLSVVLADAPSPPCRPFTGESFDVPGDLKRAALLWTPPNLIKIGMTDPEKRNLFTQAAFQSLSLELPKSRPPGLELEFSETGKTEAEWRIKPAAASRSMLRVLLPEGHWTVIATAPHHRRWTTNVVLPRSEGNPLPVDVRKLPTVKGQVLVAETGQGAAGALITDDAGRVVALADFWGHFQFVEDPRPKEIHIEHSGFGTERITLPQSDSDYIIPPVRLTRMGSLMLRLEIPEEFSFAGDPTFVVERQEAGYRWEETVRGTVESQKLAWRVSNLRPGSYRITVKGEEPLERILEKTELLSGSESEVSLILQPSFVDIHVQMGKEPLSRASIMVSGDWESVLKTGEDGSVTSHAWDTGRFLVTVEHPRLTIPFATTESILTRSEEWSVSIPGSTLSGTVRADDGTPIPGAKVVVKSEGEGVSFFIPISTDLDGNFTFTGLSGTAVLSCTADGFQPSEPLTVHVMSEQEHRVDIVLSRGKQSLVRVTRAHNPGRAGSSVLALVGQQLVAEGITIPGGTALLTLPKKRHGTIFVIEADGGFGFTHFTPEMTESGDDLIVAVAAVTSQLRVSVRESESRRPIPRLPISVRYNFMAIPPVVLAMMEQLQRRRFTTDPEGELLLNNLPNGFYELVPGFRADTAQFVPPAPIALELTGGSHTVDILLKRSSQP